MRAAPVPADAAQELVGGKYGLLAAGIAALALAVAVIWLPALAPGLHGINQMMSMAGS